MQPKEFLQPVEIVVDIETLPGPTPPRLEDIPAPANYKDPDKIRAYCEAKLDDAYRSQALNSMAGEILAIGYAIGDDPVQVIIRGKDSIDDELDLILEFQTRLLPWSPVWWIGHNIKTFDLQWLWRKALLYDARRLAKQIPRERYSKYIIDTMELWAGPDYRDKTSLSNIAGFFRIDGKQEDLTGAGVYDAYLAGQIDRIERHCADDVELTRKIYHIIWGA